MSKIAWKWYGMDGQVISDEEARLLFLNRNDERTVARDEIGEILVSTVLLCLDHRLWGQGSPLIFETMIFDGDHDEYQERYSTKEEALEGHARAVALVKGEE